MGDVDDIDIYVAEPIHQWQQTAQGQWAMQHARDLSYNISTDPTTFGHRVTIRGEVDQNIHLTEYLLKYGKI